MSWWQGILTVLFGNLITLLPMVLNAHPGTKYGVPFPVLARASFGIQVRGPGLSKAQAGAAPLRWLSMKLADLQGPAERSSHWVQQYAVSNFPKGARLDDAYRVCLHSCHNLMPAPCLPPVGR